MIRNRYKFITSSQFLLPVEKVQHSIQFSGSSVQITSLLLGVTADMCCSLPAENWVIMTFVILVVCRKTCSSLTARRRSTLWNPWTAQVIGKFKELSPVCLVFRVRHRMDNDLQVYGVKCNLFLRLDRRSVNLNITLRCVLVCMQLCIWIFVIKMCT